MPEAILILIRSILAFALLLVMTRIMGKKQISHLTFFDYCVGITIGSIAATMSVDQNVKISNGLVSLTVWGFFPIILAVIGLKNRKFLKATDGRPAIIVNNGQVMEKTMRKSKLSIDELMLLLREKGVFKLSDVEMAVLETNGQLSVMKKTDQQPVTAKILGMAIKNEQAPSLLIADGKILIDNLNKRGLSKEWLQQEIKKQGVHSEKEIFLAQLDSNGKLFLDLYKDSTVQEQFKIKQNSISRSDLQQLQSELQSFSLELKRNISNGMNSASIINLNKTVSSILAKINN